MIKIANNLEVLVKRATFSESVAGFFNPHSSDLKNYTSFGLLGALGGAGIGTLLEAFKNKEDRDYLKGILRGGGIGLGAGFGAKALGDLVAGPEAEKARIAAGIMAATGGLGNAIESSLKGISEQYPDVFDNAPADAATRQSLLQLGALRQMVDGGPFRVPIEAELK